VKSIWTILSVMAVANLLALLGLSGWLVATQRIDISRVRAIRESLQETIPQQQTREEQEAKALEEQQKKAEADARASKPPMTASEKVAVRLEATELDMQRLKKLQSDIEAIQTNIRLQQDKLAADRLELETQRKAFEDERVLVEGKAKDEQFKKTLATFEAIEPKQAVSTLREILGQSVTPPTPDAPLSPKAAEQWKTGLMYLNAMSSEKRSSMLGLFAKSDPALAARLLEGLRLLGQSAKESEDPAS